jgi:glycosyltransferase involved in cell wall biosynthesis
MTYLNLAKNCFNETGIFCAPNNPQSIANSVNLILTNHSIKENILNNAYHRVIDRYSWETVSTKMKEVFDKVSK